MHKTVEGWVERTPLTIEQFQLQAVAAASPTAQPQGHVLVDDKAVAVDAHPQTPAAVIGSQVLQGGIEQDPVEQDRFTSTQICWADRQQLGTARRWQGQGVGSDAMHANLANGPRAFDGFAPGPCRVGGDPVASWCECRHCHHQWGIGLACADAHRRLVIKLHHQVSAEPEWSGVDQGPVMQPQAQLPGAVWQQGVVAWRNDFESRLAFLQGVLKLLHHHRWRRFLQSPRGAAQCQGVSCPRVCAVLGPAQGQRRLGPGQGADQAEIGHGQQQPKQTAQHPSPQGPTRRGALGGSSRLIARNHSAAAVQAVDIVRLERPPQQAAQSNNKIGPNLFINSDSKAAISLILSVL